MYAARARNPAAAPPRYPPSYVLPDSPANMLLPDPYDIAWTVLEQAFNQTLSPGTLAVLAGTAAPSAAGSTVSAEGSGGAGSTISNFPSAPNSQADRPYQNPNTSILTPLGQFSGGQVLPANASRVLLIVQNNSPTTGGTYYVAFAVPAFTNGSIKLTPGQSLTLDAAVPRDSVNIATTGSTGSTEGVILEGSYNAVPQIPEGAPNIGAVAWGYELESSETY